MHRRFPFFVLILIVLAGLLIFGGQAGQQDAWTQGYLTGLAAAGGQDGGALPVALAMQNQRSGPGVFGVVLAFGLLALLFMALARGFRHRMGSPAGGAQGDDWMRHWQQRGSWRGCGPERSAAQGSQQDPHARQPAPAEPVETTQPATVG